MYIVIWSIICVLRACIVLNAVTPVMHVKVQHKHITSTWHYGIVVSLYAKEDDSIRSVSGINQYSELWNWYYLENGKNTLVDQYFIDVHSVQQNSQL